jgi:hypothetical protein
MQAACRKRLLLFEQGDATQQEKPSTLHNNLVKRFHETLGIGFIFILIAVELPEIVFRGNRDPVRAEP